MKIAVNFAARVAALLVLCAIVSAASGWHFSRLQSCANNLHQIAGAKGSHGLESKLDPGSRITPEDISPFLIGGWQALRCPSGGQYEPGRFTGDKETGDAQHAPACSVHGSLERLDAASRGFFADPRSYFVISIACIALGALVVLACLVGNNKLRD